MLEKEFLAPNKVKKHGEISVALFGAIRFDVQKPHKQGLFNGEGSFEK